MSASRRVAEVALRVGAELGEGPTWDDRTQTLLFLDIVAQRLHRFAPASASHLVVSTDQPVGSLALCDDGGLLLACGVDVVRADAAASTEKVLAGPLGDPGVVRMNDGKVDPYGRFVVGTMHLDESAPLATLSMLETDGTTVQLLDDVTISNGLVWADGGRTLYYIDSPTKRIDRFDVDLETGALSGRRPLVDTAPFTPDGMAIDDEGHLWVALFDGSRVHHYEPGGGLLEAIEVPEGSVTSVTFGGERRDVLYITTARKGLPAEELAVQPHAGDLFAFAAGVSGPAPNRFPWASTHSSPRR